MSTSKFRRDHIDGNQSRNKQINHVADFDNAEFKTVKAYGDGENKSIPGRKTGERMFVCNTISFKQNGVKDTDRKGRGRFAAIGVRSDDGIVKPCHLVGKAEKKKTSDGQTTKFKVRGQYVQHKTSTKKTTEK